MEGKACGGGEQKARAKEQKIRTSRALFHAVKLRSKLDTYSFLATRKMYVHCAITSTFNVRVFNIKRTVIRYCLYFFYNYVYGLITCARHFS